MITQDQARQAEQEAKWCHDLQLSEAFREIVLKELEARRDEHDRCGTDPNKTPQVRAEHHLALRLARSLLGHLDDPGLVARRKASALSTLQQWKEQHGEKLAFLPDAQNV